MPPRIIDPQKLIRQRLVLAPVPGLPDISLYAAHAGSGLRQLIEASGSDEPPYWAYQWAGGLALAHHLATHPALVRHRRVLDLGAGGGLVAIAAMKAGATSVLAAEIDAFGRAALMLNAGANGVIIETTGNDLLDGPPPGAIEVVLVGDLFYAADLAGRVTAFLDRCHAAGMTCLVGDPGRATLPFGRLERLADYAVADVGDRREAAARTGTAFVFLGSENGEALQGTDRRGAFQ